MSEETRLCTQCGPVAGPKPLSDFYASSPSKCKECIKANVRAYAKANPEKIRIRTREKKRRPKYRRREKDWIKRNPERVKAIKDRWYQKNRDKKKAEWTVSNAIRDGRMVKPDHCEQCGKKDNGAEKIA